MAKVEITSSGALGGYDTRLIIDGQDVSMYCTGLTLEIVVGEPIKLTATMMVKELDTNLDNVDVQLTEDEVSQEIRKALKMEAAHG